jgi:cation diffusion facilitator CzcD-associated flavoprotein CzcO
MHSGEYTDASAWAGKRVAVVGSSTTACDVALDCARAGATEVVMVQRGPTRIYPQAHIEEVQAMFWNAHLPVEEGDVMSTEDPVVLQATLSTLVMAQLKDSHECVWLFLCRGGFAEIKRQP